MESTSVILRFADDVVLVISDLEQLKLIRNNMEVITLHQMEFVKVYTYTRKTYKDHKMNYFNVASI